MTRDWESKTLPGRKTEREVEQAVRDLVDDSLSSEGFVAAVMEQAEASFRDWPVAA